MKIACYTDNHFCERSSILTRHGSEFTVRLENQIRSLNWAENYASEQGCDIIVCLGDFFDRATLTSQELTALNKITWAPAAKHFFIVGNHESDINNLSYSSTNVLNFFGHSVISEATVITEKDAGGDEIELAFLPYVLESNKTSLQSVFPAKSANLRILFSHNDILGLQLGQVASRTGFSIEELEAACDLCINGHLHNGMQLSERVLNLGNLTGKDFSEDSFTYHHRLLIIDTESMSVEFIENPFALNFYKLVVESKTDIEKLSELRPNSVVSVRCALDLVQDLRAAIESSKSIIESRVIIILAADGQETAADTASSQSLCIDHGEKFIECCRAIIESSDILEAELAEIIK